MKAPRPKKRGSYMTKAERQREQERLRELPPPVFTGYTNIPLALKAIKEMKMQRIKP